MHSALRASGIGMHQNSVRMHWICCISLKKVNAHILTSNQMSNTIIQQMDRCKPRPRDRLHVSLIGLS